MKYKLDDLNYVLAATGEDGETPSAWNFYPSLEHAQKAKDAYDIYFIIKHYIGGVRELAKEFEPVRDKNIVKEAKDMLAGKFASENHAGPKDVADFMDLEDEESIEMTKRDAYEQVQALLNLI